VSKTVFADESRTLSAGCFVVHHAVQCHIEIVLLDIFHTSIAEFGDAENPLYNDVVFRLSSRECGDPKCGEAINRSDRSLSSSFFSPSSYALCHMADFFPAIAPRQELNVKSTSPHK